MESHLAIQVALSLPTSSARQIYQHLILLEQQARMQGQSLRVTASRIRKGSPSLKLNDSTIRRALIVLENLNLIERIRDSDPRWGQSVRIVDLNHQDVNRLEEGLNAIASSDLGTAFGHEIRRAKATFGFWDDVENVLLEEGIDPADFFSLGFQPEDTLFGPSHELLESVKPPPKEPDPPVPQGTHAVPQGTHAVPQGTDEHGGLYTVPESLDSESGPACAGPSSTPKESSMKWDGKKRDMRSVDEKQARADRLKAQIENGERPDLSVPRRVGKKLVEETVPTDTFEEEGEESKVKTHVRGKRAKAALAEKKKKQIKLTWADWPGWPQIVEQIELLLSDEDLYPRPLFKLDENQVVIKESSNRHAYQLLELMKFGIQRAKCKWTYPAGAGKGGFAKVSLDAMLRYKRLLGEYGTPSDIDALRWLIYRMWPLAKQHVPIGDIPKVLAGWALKQARAIKRDHEFMIEAVTWQDIFGPYKWRNYRQAWETAEKQGLVGDPWEWIDALPEGRNLRNFDPETLPVVTTKEAKKAEPLFDEEAMLKRLLK